MREIPVGTILWKKAYKTGPNSNDHSRVIVEFEVTEPGICADYDEYVGDEYVMNTLEKCRVRAGKILSIYDMDNEPCSEAYSLHDTEFRYEVGQIVKPEEPFDEDNVACSSGIHGFESRQAAVNY